MSRAIQEPRNAPVLEGGLGRRFAASPPTWGETTLEADGEDAGSTPLGRAETIV